MDHFEILDEIKNDGLDRPEKVRVMVELFFQYYINLKRRIVVFFSWCQNNKKMTTSIYYYLSFIIKINIYTVEIYSIPTNRKYE